MVKFREQFINVRYKSFNKRRRINTLSTKHTKVIVNYYLIYSFYKHYYSIILYLNEFSKHFFSSNFYLISFNFKRRRFFPSLTTIFNTNFFFISLGIFFRFLKKKKNFLKSKLMYLILSSFLRKIIIFSYLQLFFVQILYFPKYFIEVLSTLLEPTKKFYLNPFKSDIRINELEWKPEFIFYSIIFRYNYNSKLIKLPQKGRLKRKISKKIILYNRIID